MKSHAWRWVKRSLHVCLHRLTTDCKSWSRQLPPQRKCIGDAHCKPATPSQKLIVHVLHVGAAAPSQVPRDHEQNSRGCQFIKNHQQTQHTTHNNTQQHTTKNTTTTSTQQQQHTTTHINTPQQTTTHHNTQQHTSTQNNTQQQHTTTHNTTTHNT